MNQISILDVLKSLNNSESENTDLEINLENQE